MKRLPLIALILLAGCRAAGTGDQSQRQAVQQGPATVSVPTVPPTVGLNPVAGSAIAPRIEASASNNAAEQSQQLGIQVAKLGERVEGIHAELSTRIDANATLSATASAEIRSTIKANAEISATASAKLESKLDALASAQVGIGNRIDATQQTVSAGHDAINKTTQYTADMAQKEISNERAHSLTLVAVVIALCAVLVIDKECSRRRAENRHRELYETFVKPDHAKTEVINFGDLK